MLKHRIKTIFLFLLVIFSLSSCKSNKKASNTVAATEDKKQMGFTKAAVIKYDVDGCTFILVLEDGTKLQPINLEEQYHIHNLPVWIKYIFQKEVMTICMAGDVIKLTAIEKEKK